MSKEPEQLELLNNHLFDSDEMAILLKFTVQEVVDIMECAKERHVDTSSMLKTAILADLTK